MPSGYMQLVAHGQQDQYLTTSPDISFFKQVYKRHSNFSMESVRQTFLTKPVLQATNRASFTCRISRVADLLKEIYLCFQLPNIYSDEQWQFQWIPHLANYMIYNAQVRMDTQLIDEKYGEWMDIWQELTLPTSKQQSYARMTGNIDRIRSPVALEPMVIVRDNKLSYSYYPTASETKPSIAGSRFYVPLPFWFCQNPALALPLIALQYQTVDVTIEFRSAEELYQLYDQVTDKYWSPEGIRQLYQARGLPIPDVTLSRFTAHGGGGPNFVDLDAYLECNFVYLDNPERVKMAASTSDYLIERVYRTEKEGITQIATIDLTLNNPIKEMVWITRRGDYPLTNEWANYTNSVPEDEGAPILLSAKIMWNGIDRIEEKPAAYFNLLQPYQHHTNTVREGVYVYSYALHPERSQPSGTFNASIIPRIQLYATFNPSQSDTNGTQVVVYSVYYNIFRVMSGQGAMVFTN